MESMKADKPQGMPMPVSTDKPEYYYGLRLCLCHEALAKLGIKDLPEVGSKLKLIAHVEVCSTSENESKEYGENKSMDLQIVEMELKGIKKEVSAEKLYDKTES